jgi:glycosyltransferase involved in cell wall biosynthesis
VKESKQSESILKSEVEVWRDSQKEEVNALSLKVMILSVVHPYDDSRIYHKQAVSLAKAGMEVELHAIADFTEKVEKGVKIVGVKRVNRRWKRLLRSWELFRRACKSEADIFHFHDPEFLPWGVLIAKLTGKPVIYDAHEDLPKQIYTKPWIYAKWRQVISKVVHHIEKGLAKRLFAVITATESIRSQFQGVQRITVIKNYPLLMPAVSKEEDGVHRILYVGGISYLRGYKEMVQMMDHLPIELQAELHLIGPLQYIAAEDRDLQQLQQKRVILHGRIPFEEVSVWLAKGKVGLVCLHPIENYRDSLPIKMFEYMAAGLPLIATNFPLWEKIVHTCGCGFTVDPLNAKEMAEKVTRLLTDSTLHAQMGRAGRTAYEKIYNWETEEKKLLALYSSFVTTQW